MINYPEFVKDKLLTIVKEMKNSPEFFVKNPGHDFTRTRKIDFETMIKLLLSMGGNSLSKELLEFFNYDANIVSSSAFVQQRDKLLPSALEFLFNKFTSHFNDYKVYKGYRLFAADGSDLNIAHNPNDSSTYFQSVPNTKGFNLLHLNALYDLCNRIYIDALIQPGKKENEYTAVVDMVDRSNINQNVIVIADRGYESYNVFAHIHEKGWKYLIRGRDITSNGILSSFKLTDTGEFDKIFSVVVTRKRTKEVKTHPEIYRILSKKSKFDYVDLDQNLFYSISFRVVRFKLSDNSYECLITNLDSSEFSAQDLKKLYHLRWGIETSFRELKYTIGLTSFHSKKMEYVHQEIFARLVMYNFCEIITSHVIIKQKHTKHGYQVNFTVAIHICKYFLRCFSSVPPPDVEALIKKYVLPIREDRKNTRRMTHKTNISFNYRVA